MFREPGQGRERPGVSGGKGKYVVPTYPWGKERFSSHRGGRGGAHRWSHYQDDRIQGDRPPCRIWYRFRTWGRKVTPWGKGVDG